MPTIGSLEELRRLPLRAMLAYGARIVRRIQPLLSGRIHELDASIEIGIRHLEKLVEGETVLRLHLDESLLITGRLGGIAPSGGKLEGWIPPEGTDAKIVFAVESLLSALQQATLGKSEETAQGVQAAINVAIQVAPNAQPLIDAARADHEQIIKIASGEFPSLGTPIAPNALGPLWPGGEPEWYAKPGPIQHSETGSGGVVFGGAAEVGVVRKQSSDAATEEVTESALAEPVSSQPELPPLTIYLDPGDSPQELISDFFLALSAYYESIGGSGLRIVNDERRVLVTEELPQ